MKSRPDAGAVRLNSELRAKNAAIKKAADQARKRKINNLWRQQYSSIIKAAMQGDFSIELSKSLVMGQKLQMLGFSIFKKNNEFTVESFSKLKLDSQVYEKAIEISIERFVSSSSQEFVNPTSYSIWIRNLLDSFRSRAIYLKDTDDDYALLNFLNSEGYRALGYDGGFNDFTKQLIPINKLIHICITDGVGLSNLRANRIRQISELIPSNLMLVKRIPNELTELTAGESYLIFWDSPASVQIDSDDVLNAKKIAWIAGQDGQKVLDYVFRKINQSKGNHVLFRISKIKGSWMLSEVFNLKTISIDDFSSIFRSKGYEIEILGDSKMMLRVSW